MNIILASNSPRRKEILSKLNIDFKVAVPNIDESIDLNNKIEDEILNISYKKAKFIFDKEKESIVIAADTIVVVDGEIFTKPDSKNSFESNVQMIKKINGRKHKVITGLTILSEKNIYKNVNISYVEVLNLSDEEIISYVNTKEGFDKAGGYAIQGIFSKFIKKIEGDYYSIMGLPLSEVYETLRDMKVL